MFLDGALREIQTAGIDVLEGGGMLEKSVGRGKKNVYLGKAVTRPTIPFQDVPPRKSVSTD